MLTTILVSQALGNTYLASSIDTFSAAEAAFFSLMP